MMNYQDEDPSWYEKYGDQIKPIAFCYVVSSVGKHVFDGCSKLKSVVLSSSIVSIGEGAFLAAAH